MQPDSQVVAIGHVIQLAVAPVFLLTGVSGLLAVLTNRLARIIDRARFLEERLALVAESEHPALHSELGQLAQRGRLINRAVRLCTVCALLTCAVIVALFVGAFLSTDVSLLIGFLFTAGMLALFLGLVTFLQEISVAIRTLKIGPHYPGRGTAPPFSEPPQSHPR